MSTIEEMLRDEAAEQRALHEAFFEKTEGRQLLAMDVHDPAQPFMVYMEQGQAPDLKPDCKLGWLRCPVQGCPAPDLTTVGRPGSGRRHHFRHVTDGNHSNETIYHHTAKHLLARWARRQYPDWHINVDDMELPSGRRPDVLLTPQRGRPIVLEVQYSPLTVEVWKARHEDYVRDGVTDLWFLGHLPPHLTGRSAGSGDVTLSNLTSSIVANGGQALWINPSEELVALGDLSFPWLRDITEAGDDLLWAVPAPLLVERLDACRLTRSGRVETPFTYERRDKEHLEAKVEWAKEKGRRRNEEIRTRKAAEEAERKRAWAQQRAAEEAATWDQFRLEAEARIGLLPDDIVLPGQPVRGLRGMDPRQWRVLVYRALCHSRLVGAVVPWMDALHAARSQAPGFSTPEEAEEAARVLLFQLRKAGYIEFQNHALSTLGPVRILKRLGPQEA